LSHPALTGISRAHLRELIEELAAPWTARCESVLRHRRGRKRKRQAGAGPKHELVFTDRVLVTLVHLRFQLPRSALVELYGLERSTITRAIGEIRPLPARRGYAAPDRPGIRLRTLADVFAYAQAEGVRLRIDGTETQVRRPQAGRPGRRAFVSGKASTSDPYSLTTSLGDDRVRGQAQPRVTAVGRIASMPKYLRANSASTASSWGTAHPSAVLPPP
jgi:hypothetical protein